MCLKWTDNLPTDRGQQGPHNSMFVFMLLAVVRLACLLTLLVVAVGVLIIAGVVTYCGLLLLLVPISQALVAIAWWRSRGGFQLRLQGKRQTIAGIEVFLRSSSTGLSSSKDILQGFL